MEFLLKNCMRHSQYAFPESMVSYPVRFEEPVEEACLQLTLEGQPVCFQLSEKQYDRGLLRAAVLSFTTDLPENSRKRFVLGSGAGVTIAPIATCSADTVLMQNRFLSVKIGKDTPVFTICQGGVEGIATTNTPCQ